MEVYALTEEFWQNMLYGILMGLSGCFGLWCISRIEKSGEFDTDLQRFVQIVVGAFLFLIIPVGLSEQISYNKLKEGKRGPVMALRGISPQLYSHFVELEGIQSKEDELIKRLQAEKKEATSGSAHELYEKQIAEANKRKSSIKSMWWRINNLATEIYFSEYLKKLEQNTTSDNFRAELQEIKRECDELMRLHASVHD